MVVNGPLRSPIQLRTDVIQQATSHPILRSFDPIAFPALFRLIFMSSNKEKETKHLPRQPNPKTARPKIAKTIPNCDKHNLHTSHPLNQLYFNKSIR